MAKPSKDEFLMQAIETVVDMAAQSTERIADLLPADLFPAQPDPGMDLTQFMQKRAEANRPSSSYDEVV